MSALVTVVQDILAQVPQEAGRGRIAGGWEYIWTCYAITWAGLSLYALSLWMRRSVKAEGMEQ
jgi:hypothetical protein